MYSVNYIFLWLTLFSVSRLQNIVLSIKKLRSIGGEEEKREIKEAGEGKRIKENLKIENELLKTGGGGEAAGVLFSARGGSENLVWADRV